MMLWFHLAKPSPSVAGGNVLGPEGGEDDVELDEPAPKRTSDAAHDHIDRQFPDIVPEARPVQRDAVVV